MMGLLRYHFYRANVCGTLQREVFAQAQPRSTTAEPSARSAALSALFCRMQIGQQGRGGGAHGASP